MSHLIELADRDIDLRCGALIPLQAPEFSYRHSAVDAVVLPRDESSIITQQVHHETRNFLSCRKTPDRLPSNEACVGGREIARRCDAFTK